MPNPQRLSDDNEASLLEGKCEADDNQQDQKKQALALKWAFGFNKSVIGGVHNLSTDYRNAVFYFAAHTGIIYDYVQRKQTLLQGHCNMITCCTVSEDKRWIVTADQGENSMIVIWDAVTGTPIKTIFDPHPNGVASIDMSPDAMFLVTLSSNLNDTTVPQEVAVWEWTVDREGPLYSMECPNVKLSRKKKGGASPAESKFADEESSTYLPLEHIRFNSYDIKEFVTTGPNHITFWSWANKELEHQTPPKLPKADFGGNVGDFTQTNFLPNTFRAVSGTSEGNLVLWDVAASASTDENPFSEALVESKTNVVASMISRLAIKVVKLNRTGSIPYLTTKNDMLVVCGGDESVRFYDLDFRIIAWFEDLDAGPITSVSFANTTSFHYVDTPLDAMSSGIGAGGSDDVKNSTTASKFALSDFVVSTTRALIVGVDAATFDEANPELRHGTLLLQGFDGPIESICCHPSESTCVAVSKTGIIQAWDFEGKRLQMVRVLHKDDRPVCSAFSKDGNFIAIGCQDGSLRILRWAFKKDMGELACFHIHNRGYTKLEFSPDGCFLAAADEENCVSLFRFISEDVIGEDGEKYNGVDEMPVNQGKRFSEPGPGIEPCDGSDSRNGWTYIGRHGSHCAPICGLTFGYTMDEEIRFVSLGQDGTLVEYDLESSSVIDGVKLAAPPKRIEFGLCKPTSCMICPTMGGQCEDIIITANTEYKIKAFNGNNKTCRKTVLGPTYGAPLSELRLLSQETQAGEYLAYATADKVIGLIKTPLDGNPYRAMGLIAHPGEITGFETSHDGKYLISSGGSDMTINIWSVNTSALDATCLAASSESVRGISKTLVPFLTLIDGGHTGELFQEIVDYFYYAQLRCQGEDTTSPRRTDGQIPLSEVPNLMRALGFYPTEQQIEDMCSEIRYSEFSTSAKTVDTINIDQFTKLYLNHRPVNGVSLDEISGALETIATEVKRGCHWKVLHDLLTTNGETMPAGELENCLTILMGRSAVSSIRPNSEITPDIFAGDMLGLQPVVEQQLLEEHGHK